jgi:L-fuconolactonase
MTPPRTIDAHQHFWDPATAHYPWMTDALASVRRRFAQEDLRPVLDEASIDATILVQMRPSVEETEGFLEIAAATDFVAGVVGWVDLADAAVADRIAELRARPDGHLLVGVRHQVHDEPDAKWLLRDDIQRGLRTVGDAGLVYDLLVRPRELPAALETARRNPELRFVIDHIAKPEIARGELKPWAERLAPFAPLEHVACKLSGMVTEADWGAWTPSDLVPYAERVLGWFGSSRLLYGSDWPVCLLAASYREVREAAELALGELSAGERAQIFGGVAANVYRLHDTTGGDRG